MCRHKLRELFDSTCSSACDGDTSNHTVRFSRKNCLHIQFWYKDTGDRQYSVMWYNMILHLVNVISHADFFFFFFLFLFRPVLLFLQADANTHWAGDSLLSLCFFTVFTLVVIHLHYILILTLINFIYLVYIWKKRSVSKKSASKSASKKFN